MKITVSVNDDNAEFQKSACMSTRAMLNSVDQGICQHWGNAEFRKSARLSTQVMMNPENQFICQPQAW